ncbi:MAG TPA: BCCT family transporter, partial [Kiloniellaceae bacterium]|nr:BCCT family transporter [Kiloniellaceae bacterium]
MSDDTHTPPENLVAKSGFFAGSNTIMSIASMVMIIGFVAFTVWDVDYSGEIFAKGKDFIIETLDWFYVLVVTIVLFFVIWLLFSRFGGMKLGKDDDEPDFSTFSWICMLFSAGLGSGLIYWGVAEPMYHIQGNPFLTHEGIEPNGVEAAAVAIRITNFHWGLHGWALYVLVGLCLAYFSYRKGLPLSLRAALYPVLKEKVYGPWGHAVDLIGVFGTIFGLATSLGLGVAPIASGMEELGWMEDTTTNELILIACITAIGTASAVSGVGRGVRILSECNVWASLVLLIIFIVLGPTAFILGMVITGAGDYMWNVIPMGFWIDGDPERQWQSWWTVFYWGWWIAWCPFVGLFIARISKGRTIRQFCFCVLLIPTSVVVLWMGVFGGAAVGVDLFHNAGVVDAVNANYADGVFKTVAGFGYDSLVTPITILITVLLVSWFVTSSDSGTLVMCTMLSMGDEHPPIKFRLFWGITSGVVAAVLLIAGGLSALQTASIVAGLPIAVILLVMAYGIVKTLHEDFPV